MAHTGLALLGDTTLHKALLLIGGPRSGKGTSMHLSNTYTIFGVTGNPDTSLRQVQAGPGRVPSLAANSTRIVSPLGKQSRTWADTTTACSPARSL